VLILSHDDVHAALTPAACAKAMREVLAAHARGETWMPLRSVMRPPHANGLMGLMPAWRPDEFALKAICVMPGNPARGLDSHQGVVVLFDGEIGVPRAILDASAVTAIRTAAVSAVATEALARRDARVLGVLGAGVQGRAHVRALADVRQFDEVRVYAPTIAHVEALIEEFPGLPVRACESAEAASRGADVVVTATTSPTPVLRLEWLASGAHVNAVGASLPSARELDSETFAACAVFPDSRESLQNEAGEYLTALRDGLIDGERHVRAELGEVLAGMHPGRAREQELTLFRSLGLAVEDLAAARVAVERARGAGIGTEVPL